MTGEKQGIPPLAAVRCFEAAARHLSFTHAAEELGMTQAAVSYQIKVLEDRMGPLFVRKSKGVELTEAARRLAPEVTTAFDALRAAFRVHQQTNESVLSITSLDIFATNWLVPKLGAFQVEHPDLAVRLDVTARPVDFTREDFDVGIRHNADGHWPGLVSHPLFPLSYTPMVSPELLAKSGPLQTARDLLKLPIIDPLDPWWTDWFEGVGVSDIDFRRMKNIELGKQRLAGQAALAGQGVAILTPAFYRAELESGRLVQPFSHIGGQEGMCCLVYPEWRKTSPKIRTFRDWIVRELKQDGGRFEEKSRESNP